MDSNSSQRDQFGYYFTEQPPPGVSYTSTSHNMSSDFQLSPLPSKSKAYNSIQEREECLISPLQISNFDWETSAAVSMPDNHANDYNNYGVQHSYMHHQPLPFDSNTSGVVQQSLAITADHVDAFSQHLLPPAQAPHEAAAVHPSALLNTAGKQALLPPRPSAPRPSAPLITSTTTMAPPNANASMFSELLQYAAALHQHNLADDNTAYDTPALTSHHQEMFSDHKTASVRPDLPPSQGFFHEEKPPHFEEPNQVSCNPNIPTHPTRLSISSDESFLDPVQNFFRSACVEVFVADDHNPGRGAKPKIKDQVGLRCGHCKHVHSSKRAKQSVSFPSKTTNIFESVRNFQRTHFEACQYIPDELKVRYKKLMREVYKKIHQKYIKAYYAEAGCEIGLMDTPNGIIFGAPPNLSGKPSEKLLAIMKIAKDPVASAHLEELIFPKVDRRLENMKFSHIASENTRQVVAKCRQQKTCFVFPSDFPTLSDFRFVLYHQFCPCRPPNTALNRRKIRPDKWDTLSGLCCRYCAKARPEERYHRGMYFPLDLESLHDSSFSHNLQVHLMTCQHTPFEIKEALEELQRLAVETGVSTKRGSKKKFMEKLWERMANYYPAP